MTSKPKDAGDPGGGPPGGHSERWLDSEALEKTLVARKIGLDSEPTATLRWRGRRAPRAKVVSPPLPRLEIGDDETASTEYRVLGELGEGGMGVVELASQRSLDREVAIKRLHTEHGEAQVEALLEEARITGYLEHPNIVPVHALATDRERGPVVVMKRIQGTPWDSLICAGKTSLTRHIEIIMQACNALHFAHSKGIVHCDLKPANVMVGEFGEVYVVDWGIALRPSEEGEQMLRGSPAYMAPELVHGVRRDIGPWTDVFLLGACLHEVLTDQPRHRGMSLVGILNAAARAEPATYDDTVPASLAAICNRACAASRSDRYQTAAEFRSALQDYLDERSATALAQAAEQRLHVLERAIAERNADVDSLFRATEFAFEYVLETRPGLAVAKIGLQRCLTAMLGYQLEREELSAAEALADRIDQVPAPMRARLESLREAWAAARARHAQLEHASDAGVSRTQRQRFGIALALFMLTLVGTLFYFNRGATTAFSPSGLLVIAVALWAFTAGCILVWRRHLLANDYNKRWIQFVFGTVSALVLHRAVHVIVGTDPTQIIVGDLAIGGCAFLAAASLSRFLYVVGTVVFLLAGLAAWEPAWARSLLNFGGVGMAASLWWLWRIGRREGPDASAAASLVDAHGVVGVGHSAALGDREAE